MRQTTTTKEDKCFTGFLNCFLRYDDFETAEIQLTNPQAMDEDENGNLQGSCATAIWNRVEGELCCTTGMQQLAVCVPREVGDYTVCKNSWNAVYGSNFYDKAAAIMVAFDNDGYCTSLQTVTTTKTTTPPQTVTTTKATTPPQTTTKATTPQIVATTKTTTRPQIVATTKATTPPQIVTTAKATTPPQSVATTEVNTPSSGSTACTICGMNKKTGRTNCCAPGGSWYLNCGAGYDHTWPEGSLVCQPRGLYVCLSI